MPRDPADDAAAPDPVRRSLAIEPRRLSRGRSTLAPAALALGATAFVLIALLKPWNAGGGGAATVPPGGSGSSSTTVSPGSRAAPAPGGSSAVQVPAPAPFPSSPTAADLVASSRPHTDWGIRAIVVPAGRSPRGDGSGAGLTERWSAVDLAGDVWDLGAHGSPVGAADAVFALGVTTPVDALPLDMRFWRMGAAGTPARIVPIPIPGPDPGSWLWRPDPTDATMLGTWPAGTYRIDVLLGSRIVRLITNVPGTLGPATPASSPAATPVPLPANLALHLQALPVGLVAVAGGDVFHLVATPSGRLDELATWLDPGLAAPLSMLAPLPSDDVSALGAVLPPGASNPHLGIELLAPIAGSVVVPIETIPLNATAAPGTTPSSAVLATSEPGHPFATGIYELIVSWTDPQGDDRAEVWHIDIVPTIPPVPPLSPLDSLRHWAADVSVAGGTRGEPIVTDLDLVDGPGTGTCGHEASITSTDHLLAVAAAAGVTTIGARLYRQDGSRVVDTRLLPGRPETAGLTLLSLPADGLAPGTYRLEVDRRWGAGDPTVTWAYTVCVR